MSQQKFEQWAIVEVMGHNRFVGYVTEIVIAGTGFIQVTIPATSKQPEWTRVLGASSIYAITPVNESIARSMAEGLNAVPVRPYELPISPSPYPRIEHVEDDGLDDYLEDTDVLEGDENE